MFITAFTRARYLSLSCTRSINSMALYPTSKPPFNIILPFTHRYSKWYVSLRSTQENFVCTSSVAYKCHTPRTLIFHDLITRIIFGEEYEHHHVLDDGFHTLEWTTVNALGQAEDAIVKQPVVVVVCVPVYLTG